MDIRTTITCAPPVPSPASKFHPQQFNPALHKHERATFSFVPLQAALKQHSLRDDLSSRTVRYDGDVRPGLLVHLEIGQNPLAIPRAASDKSPQQDAMANSRSTTSWVDAQLDVIELDGQWEAAMRQFPRKSWQHE